jgi:hypothetical protein
MTLYAVDTETTRFTPREYGWNKKTHITPFGYPDFVVASIASEEEAFLQHRGFCMWFKAADDNYADFVFHNVSFDYQVIIKRWPELRARLDRAIDEGRVHDTIILDLLLQIARGDRVAGQRLRARTLQVLAKQYADMDLSKDDHVRLEFGAYKDCPGDLPEEMKEYALDDARATLLVYKSLRRRLEHASSQDSDFPVHPDTSKWGLATETIQVQGAIAHSWLEQHPLRVDVPLAKERTEELHVEAKRLEDLLIKAKMARRGPKSGKFSMSFKAVRSRLAKYAQERDIVPEKSDTGLLSLNERFWKQNLPKHGKTKLEKDILLWYAFCRMRKLLQTYLYVYSSSEVHYPTWYNLGAFTGRTACANPNVQNIPKRRDSIRALFVPSPGRVFLEAETSNLPSS